MDSVIKMLAFDKALFVSCLFILFVRLLIIAKQVYCVASNPLPISNRAGAAIDCGALSQLMLMLFPRNSSSYRFLGLWFPYAIPFIHIALIIYSPRERVEPFIKTRRHRRQARQQNLIHKRLGHSKDLLYLPYGF